MATKVSGNAIYSWWTHPIVQRRGSDTWFTGISDVGNQRLFKNDSTMFEQLRQVSDDDHNAPAVLAQEDKDTLVFATKHNADGVIKLWRDTDGDMNFVAQSDIVYANNCTYVQLLTYGDTIVLLTRSPVRRWVFRVSTDWGATWSAATPFIECSIDDNFYLTCTESPTTPGFYHMALAQHPTGSLKKIYYGNIDLTTGDVSNGTALNNLYSWTGGALSESVFSDVGVIQNNNQCVRLLDVGQQHGKAVIYYAKWQNTGATPNYYQAYHNGSAWVRTDLSLVAPIFAYSGAANYVGGISMDKDDNDKIYVSLKGGPSGSGSTWTINEYPVNSDFTLGTRETLATNTEYPLVRPYATPAHDSVLYQELRTYTGYTNYMAWLWQIDW